MKDIRVVYMGTPDFSLKPLELLIEKCNVVMVVTKPDALVGRKKELQKSPVKILAEKNNIPVFTPNNLKKEYSVIIDAKPDLIVTCAYGKILPKIILDYPRFGCINIHASLLPKYRGSAPIQWALINGEDVTGVTLMYMDEGMDTGDMIDKIEYKIKNEDNVGILHDVLSELGKEVLDNNLENLISGNIKREKQNNNDATYAPMIEREMEDIDFSDTVDKIYNKVRAFNPWPLTRVKIKNEELKVVNVSIKKCNSVINKLYLEKDSLGIGAKDGIVYLEKIKPIGKNIMDIKSYLNGKYKDLID